MSSSGLVNELQTAYSKAFASLNIKEDTPESKTLARRFRVLNASAQHILDLSDAALDAELRPLLKILTGSKTLNGYKEFKQEYYNAIHSVLTDMISNSREYTVTSVGKDMYSIVSKTPEASKDIFGAIGRWKRAISENKNLEKAYNKLVKEYAKLDGTSLREFNSRLHLGHSDDSYTNVSKAFGAISTHLVATSGPTSSAQYMKGAEDIINAAGSVDALVSAMASELFMGAGGARSKLNLEITKACISATLLAVKNFDGSLELTLNSELDEATYAKIAKSMVTGLKFQRGIGKDGNTSIGARLERRVANMLSAKGSSRFFKVLNNVVDRLMDSSPELRSSKPAIERTLDAATEAILSDRPTRKKKSTSSGVLKIKPPVLTPKKSRTTTKPVRPEKLPPLRNTKGQFTSIANLTTLINAGLEEQVKKNMHRPFLRNQTGRFAHSVHTVGGTRERDGAVTMFLIYMKYPYQTFEPGFAQRHKGYDPRPLIEKSVRELAVSLVRERMRVVFV